MNKPYFWDPTLKKFNDRSDINTYPYNLCRLFAKNVSSLPLFYLLYLNAFISTSKFVSVHFAIATSLPPLRDLTTVNILLQRMKYNTYLFPGSKAKSL